MKMSRRKVRETIFLLLFRVEFNTQIGRASCRERV